ncbi:MFS transporter [Nonomuraea sp. NPDC049158]|uniref:MFS transporter n=1 Tax=Nonomuraea sp. NPDC049158 TaxID=3155649 RepID=UPI0033D7C651
MTAASGASSGSSAASASTSSYGVLMVGRFLSAFAHGAYFGIGSVVAADLVAPRKRASAIALMFTGLTLANVLGVPLGTWIGQAFGWRATFWAVVAIGVAGLIGVPAQPRPEGGGMPRELATFREGGVWLALAMTVFGFAPVFAVITFISPITTDVGGFSPGAVPVVMALFGVAAFATVPPRCSGWLWRDSPACRPAANSSRPPDDNARGPLKAAAQLNSSSTLSAVTALTVQRSRRL